MNFSRETLKLAELCWNGNQIMAVSVRVGMDYTRDGETYKIRLKTVDELYKYQQVSEKKFKITRFTSEKGDVINLMGVHN